MWTSQFETPTIDGLLSALPEDSRVEMERARKRLGRPSVRWNGLPWRWTVRLERDSGSAALIPDPEAPRIALSLPTGFFAEHPPEGMSRQHRELLVRAVVVADVVWSEWSLGVPGACDTVLDFVGE